MGNNIDKQYQALLQDILDSGVRKGDRTGTGTISVFGRQIRHRMSEGFPLITTKKMYFNGIVTELLWFLRGDTNIKYLVDNDCHIWDGDAYQGYLKRVDKGLIPASKERFIEMIKNGEESRVDANGWRIGELGPIYGKQWRAWDRFIYDPYQRENNATFRVEEVQTIDQIADAIHKLKTNPDDRGIIVSAWHVGELDQMVLRPCHNFFQFYTRELSLEERTNLCTSNITTSNILEVSENCKSIGFDEDDFLHQQLDLFNVPRRAISLMYNQRSVDTGLGLSFNIASYALLLIMIAKQVNMIPDELIGNLGDVHLYLNHIEPIKEQLTREPYELPTVKISDRVVNDISEYTLDDIILENYQSHPTIKMPLSN